MKVLPIIMIKLKILDFSVQFHKLSYILAIIVTKLKVEILSFKIKNFGYNHA